jgi:hypothetical protein
MYRLPVEALCLAVFESQGSGESKRRLIADVCLAANEPLPFVASEFDVAAVM